jgi:hypothetical protein
MGSISTRMEKKSIVNNGYKKKKAANQYDCFLFSADLEREINMRNTLSNGAHTKHINIYIQI